ncbi:MULTISPECIES: TonB family protein [Rheinheimera]|jgi:TonB family protein|uniref:TonB family protein n=1 Tax=Rheinheimera TaxID=67575 RepID=UPI001E2B33B6|nr:MULTISPECIES: TonB family protein [Rheinheimera]MCD1599559.1 energy transducer TonB [Rheinheimera aquimaris]
MRYLLILALLFSVTSKADMIEALRAYEEKDFVKAKAEFADLLPLGNDIAAYNLAAMAHLGQDTASTETEAIALFKFAAFLGHPNAGELAEKLSLKLSDEQKTQVETKFKLLQEQLQIAVEPIEVPADFSFINPIPVRARAAEYPFQAKEAGLSGFNILRYLVDGEGKVQVVDVLHSYPKERFDYASVKALRKWRYEATGETRIMHMQFIYILDDGASFNKAIRLMDEGKIWDYAMLGSADHQQAMGSLLYIMHNQSDYKFLIERGGDLALQRPDFSYIEPRMTPQFRLKALRGIAIVRTDDQGVINEIVQGSELISPKANELLKMQIEKVDRAGLFFIGRLPDAPDYEKIVVTPVAQIPQNYTASYWWNLAARSGDEKAQRFLAAFDDKWREYMVSKGDVSSMTWQGASYIIDGNIKEGNRLLNKAAETGYRSAQELKAFFQP